MGLISRTNQDTSPKKLKIFYILNLRKIGIRGKSGIHGKNSRLSDQNKAIESSSFETNFKFHLKLLEIRHFELRVELRLTDLYASQF